MSDTYTRCYEALVELQWAKDAQWLRSARIGGSYSRDEADDVADLDVFFVVSPEYYRLDTALRLANLLGKHVVLDVPRISESWGIWITGFFLDLGYVDIMIRSEAGPLVSYMADPSSVVVFDKTGATRHHVANSGAHRTPVAHLVKSHSSTAWLRLFLASKAFKRRQYLQSRLYMLEAMESIVALRRLALNIPPPGRNYDHPLRDIESTMPDVALRIKRIADMNMYSGASGRKQIRLARDLLISELKAHAVFDQAQPGVTDAGLAVLEQQTEEMLGDLNENGLPDSSEDVE